MSEQLPRVSVGLPVYNGEKYAADVIESLLGQTYGDFELIVSDNASTDRTEAICRSFARRDSRIRYYRADVNRGAAWNYNRVAELARGQYFKWAACDDICRPEFLERCVEVLDRNPDVVWCFPRTTFIDESGRLIAEPAAEVHTYASDADEGRPEPAGGSRLVRHPPGRESAHAHERFAAVLLDFGGAYDHYGLIRTEVLRNTGIERPFLGSDKVLVAELSLRGRFAEIPEVLMLWRHHAAQWGMQSRLTASRVVSGQWNRRFFVPRRIRCTYWYLRLILESHISRYERLRCLGSLAYTVRQPRRWMYVLEELARRRGSAGEPASPALEEMCLAHSPTNR
jgi:glycosyltransferase involved in cell wall biosynthesis